MKNNNKGFTLIELVLSVAIVGIIIPVIFSMLQFGLDTFFSSSRYNMQQDVVLDALQILKKDISEACYIKVVDATGAVTAVGTSVNFNDRVNLDSTKRKWTFKDNNLYFQLGNGTEQQVVQGFDTDVDQCKFELSQNKLYIYIKPIKDNLKFENKNILEPIISEFYVGYKFNN